MTKSLVLLTGPVGGGKSATAAALADRIRAAGEACAVIDLDLVYCMARQRDGFADLESWRVARRAAAELANAFFTEGVATVVLEGGFYDDDEREDVLGRLGTDVDVVSLTLKVSRDETFNRVRDDPSLDRVATRDPRILDFLYAQFARALPFLERSSIVIDADDTDVDGVAAAVFDAL